MKRALVLLCATALACAQTPRDKILQASVIVYGTIQENGKMNPVSRGGGFLIDPRHVVTNLNACCAKTERGQAVLTVVVAGEDDKDVSTAKLIWSSAEAEIAILELKDPLQRPAIALAPFKAVEKDQAVYTAQFPDPGEKGTQPTITEGKLTGLVKIENSEIQVYKTTAAMNKANSGGALFDACGNAIGINMMVKESVQYAYVIDPLFAGLKAAGLTPQVVSAHCGSPSGEKGSAPARREWRLPEGAEWIPVGLLAAALLMAFRSPKKTASSPMPMQPLPEPETYAPPGTARPALRGLAGEYAGKSFALDRGTSTLGRDQRVANLVFSSDASSISKRHCMVSWDAARNTFVLEDLGSTNGTFLSTGERLKPGQPRDLPAGARFSIGDLRNQFELKLDS